MVVKEYKKQAGVYKVQTFGTTHVAIPFHHILGPSFVGWQVPVWNIINNFIKIIKAFLSLSRPILRH